MTNYLYYDKNLFDTYYVGSDFVFIDISQNGKYAAIDSLNNLYFWEYDNFTSIYSSPTIIGSGFASVSLGVFHNLAIKTNGDLYAWGLNSSGQLGDGTTVDKSVPTFIGSNFSFVSAGQYHSIAIKTNGDLYAWGDGLNGELGNGSSSIITTPTLIGSNYLSASAGGHFSLFLKSNGDLYGCGSNAWGQIGIGSITPPILTPTFITNNIASLSKIYNFTAGAIKSNGDLYVWGESTFGQTGASLSSTLTPTFLASNILKATCGYTSTTFIDNSGSLYYVGDGAANPPVLTPTFINNKGYVDYVGEYAPHSIFLSNNGVSSSSGSSNSSNSSSSSSKSSATSLSESFSSGSSNSSSSRSSNSSSSSSKSSNSSSSSSKSNSSNSSSSFISHENRIFLKLNAIKNFCSNNRNGIDPNGNYSEADDLFEKWKKELEAQPNVHVSKIIEPCDYSSSSSKSSPSSSSISSNSSSSISSLSSNSSSSSKSSTSSSSSKSLSSSSLSSASNSSSSSSSSKSSSSSSFDERCVPVIFSGVESSYFGRASSLSKLDLLSLNPQLFYAIGASLEDKVYIYKVNTPNPPTGVPGYSLITTISSPLVNSGFGSSVALSSDGSELIVGCPNYNNDKGAVVIFKTTNEWLSNTYQVIISPDGSGTSISNVYGDNFGKSVDVTDDGSIIIVGAPGNSNNVNTNGINAGAIYIFDNSGNLLSKNITQTGQQQDYFGWDVSISSNGDRFVSSAHGSNSNGIDSGAVYVFERVGITNVWIEKNKLTASDGVAGDKFGFSVALAKYANKIIVGSYKNSNIQGTYAGAAYLYELSGLTWNETKIIPGDLVNHSSFGFDVSIAGDGKTIAISQLNYNYEYEPSVGSVYVYTKNPSLTFEIKFSDVYDNYDLYGINVSISEDGSYLGVGAPKYDNKGLSHLYKLNCFF